MTCLQDTSNAARKHIQKDLTHKLSAHGVCTPTSAVEAWEGSACHTRNGSYTSCALNSIKATRSTERALHTIAESFPHHPLERPDGAGGGLHQFTASVFFLCRFECLASQARQSTSGDCHGVPLCRGRLYAFGHGPTTPPHVPL